MNAGEEGVLGYWKQFLTPRQPSKGLKRAALNPACSKLICYNSATAETYCVFFLTPSQIFHHDQSRLFFSFFKWKINYPRLLAYYRCKDLDIFQDKKHFFPSIFQLKTFVFFIAFFTNKEIRLKKVLLHNTLTDV